MVHIVEAAFDIEEHRAGFKASRLRFFDPVLKGDSCVERSPLGQTPCLPDRVYVIRLRKFDESLINDPFGYFEEGLHQGNDPITGECIVVFFSRFGEKYAQSILEGGGCIDHRNKSLSRVGITSGSVLWIPFHTP